MTFASTPDSAMFGEPMVYVQFTSASDEAGCSTSVAYGERRRREMKARVSEGLGGGGHGLKF